MPAEPHEAVHGNEAFAPIGPDVAEPAALITPEVLTEMHGADVGLVAAPSVPGGADMAEPADRLIPPPSKVGKASEPGYALAQGTGGTAFE
jgi:hypothetical protein